MNGMFAVYLEYVIYIRNYIPFKYIAIAIFAYNIVVMDNCYNGKLKVKHSTKKTRVTF